MSLRTNLLRMLAQELDNEPFQPAYHKKPHGKPMTGWGERLSIYFWPNPNVDYSFTSQLMEPWFSEAGHLSQRLIDYGYWSQAERVQAKALAWQMLKWGGVTRQKLFSEATVEAVFRKGLGLNTTGLLPMNSGWTKVAALATAYLEGGDKRQPHAIWDSWVSTSLVSRLDRLLINAGCEHPKQVFPKIGTVPGRGGTRPRTFMLKWAHVYGSWAAQEAGSELVRELRDLLNKEFAPMPLPESGTGRWTVRGVESLLFMDGY